MELTRVVTALTDAATSAAAGRPVRIRVAISPESLLGGRLRRMSCSVDDVSVGGLTLARLRIDGYRVGLVPGWPVRVRAARVRIRATVEQAALDEWLRSAAMPVRIRLGDEGLAIRAGIGGLRLAEVRAAVEIEGGRLMVTPQRTELLGVAVASPSLRVPLPVPPLPRRTTVAAVAVSAGRAVVTLEVPDVDEALEPATWRRAGRLVARP